MVSVPDAASGENGKRRKEREKETGSRLCGSNWTCSSRLKLVSSNQSEKVERERRERR